MPQEGFEMKRLVLLMVIGFGIADYSQAATTTTSPVPFKSPNPQAHQINLRLRNQWMLVQKGIKSGKFTKEQGATYRASLKAVREQEVGFFKLNKNHELTTDQVTQLNTALNQNSSSLGETPTSN
jgi:hypothetical protein